MVLVAAVGMTSCSSVKQTAPVMAIGGNNIKTNVKADIDYDGVKKISGEATTKRVLWIFSKTTNGGTIKASNHYKDLNYTENVALYKAKTAADADIVLEPQFETKTKTYFLGIYKKTDVKVTGWGAKIKGFQEGPVSNDVVR